MTRFTLLLLVVLLGGADRLAAQEKVEARGITSVIKLEEVTFGHLTELNTLRPHGVWRKLHTTAPRR